MSETAATATSADTTPQQLELLVDRFLPRFDATRREHLVVDADSGTTWSALERLDLMQVHTPLLDAAMTVRGLPARVSTVLGRGAPVPPPPRSLHLLGDDPPALPGWLPLGTRPGQEVVLGAVGRFWRPQIEWFDVAAMTPEGFADFGEPTWGRIATSLSLLPYGRTRTLVTYEARTAVADDASRRLFLRYWAVVGPFAGHIMKATLAALQRECAHADRTVRLP